MAATSAATSHISLEEYRRSEFEPDAEYVDGEIEERPMGEFDHAAWQRAILLWLWRHEADWNLRVMQELRVQVSPTRFRVPDVTVLDREWPIEQVITHPPLAVFEVLSPEDTMSRMLRKLNDYAAMGIPRIWVIAPKSGQSYRFVAGALTPACEFGAAGDRIHFLLSDIAALLD